MKNTIAIILFCLLDCAVSAQKIVEKNISYNTNQAIKLNIQIADSIRIITWNKNEVYTKASIDINDNKNNDVYITEFIESGSDIEVKAHFDEKKIREIASNDTCKCCCNYRSKIYWDVYMPEQAQFSVETIDGNIIIEGKTQAMKVHSISGFIDLAFAKERKAEFKMSTISGTIYTDLAFNKREDKRSNNISSQYNGGGAMIELETISGDIYLRKTP